jgi:hypothetical protein
MSYVSSNPCIRCGKERIVSETRSQMVGNSQSMVTYINTVCPDKECQKIVDQGILALKEKKDAINLKRAQEKEERAKILAASKA